ncbi:MAG: helix-turn-helix domain-containing protein [Candidatus Moraniibacteriota bacterium]
MTPTTPQKLKASGCPKRALEIFGDFQTLSIVDTLAIGEMRYCELQRALDNMNPVTLVRRLKKLEEDDIIERREETIDKLSVSYRLKAKGEHMLPILRSIKDFAEKHLT